MYGLLLVLLNNYKYENESDKSIHTVENEAKREELSFENKIDSIYPLQDKPCGNNKHFDGLF
jgi:hypothetical protein